MIYLGDVLEHVSYSDTEMECIQLADDDMRDQCLLVVRCESTDNFDTTKKFRVCRGRIVPSYYHSEQEAINVVQDLIYYVAMHEADEKLLYKGERIADPHSTFVRSPRP